MTQQAEHELTARQKQAYDFICRNAGLYGPTIREIAEHMSITSPAGVVGHLRALERKGLIRRLPGAARGIEVVR